MSYLDFKKCLEGGCFFFCDIKKNCGYVCLLFCYLRDFKYKNIECESFCLKWCELNYLC